MTAKKREEDNLQQVSKGETAVILEHLRKVLRDGVAGDVVEFGCYRGDTSLLMERVLEREFPSEKRLWIYDSFEGLPERTKFDASVAGDGFSAGELFVTKREVVERFKKAGLKVPRVRKGFFEDLDAGVFDENGVLIQSTSDLPEKIAFAFLDGDLYQSIKTSLALVTPRMVKGGIILIHDYNNPQLPGVAKAVEEWLGNQKLKQHESLAIFVIE